MTPSVRAVAAVFVAALLAASVSSAVDRSALGRMLRAGRGAVDIPAEPPPEPVAFSRTVGLQTNETELARHVAFGVTEPYAADRSSMEGHATTARDAWPYTITATDWSGEGGACDPVGQSPSAAFDLRNASTDILALAMAGYTTGTSSYYTAARTRILELVGITDFEAADLSGSNECILDLGTAIPNVLEAAWLLEDVGGTGWTNADRVALADWLVAEVFPLVSWAPQARKNNWGIVTLRAAIYAAAYVEGGVPSLTLWDTSTTTPAAYLSGVGTVLAEWLSASVGDELDSDCDAAGQVFGLQASGAFPDELRRTGGTANCGAASIAFDCTDSTTCAASGAHFYQHKATAALAGVCEALRRIDGDGARCFDLVSHGGANTVVEDALRFATGGDFQSYFVPDTTQGARYILGEYLEDGCILDALDDGDVSVRGGRDVAYSRITHAPGVANLVAATPCPGPPGAFVPLSSSDLDGLAGIPNVYQVPAVDTSGWITYDATCKDGDACTPAAGTTALPSGLPCSSATVAAGDDDAPDVACIWNNIGTEALLHFPDGDYAIETPQDGRSLIRPGPNNDRRGIACESHAALFTIHASYSQDLMFFDFESNEYAAAATAWNAGAGDVAGETVIPVASTAGFSTTDYAPGSWVELRADPLPTQDNTPRVWRTKVASIGASSITIRDPLPDDFTGGNATARAWSPAEDIPVRGCEFRIAEPDHQSAEFGFFFNLQGAAHVEFDRVRTRGGYRAHIISTSVADLRIHHSDFWESSFDKGSNGYGLWLAGFSRLWIHDTGVEHPTGIAFGGQAQSGLVTFYAHLPTGVNPLFDVGCNGGDGNDCTIVDHCSVHGATYPPEAGCGHCSTREEDLLGLNGDASCRGTPAGANYSCFEFHNEAASNVLVERAYCDAPVWYDTNTGPGRHNVFHAIHLTSPWDGTPRFDTAPGQPGDFHIRYNGDPPTGSYEQNTTWVNTLFEGNLGNGDSYNLYGNGVRVLDTVVMGSCTDADLVQPGPDGGACTGTVSRTPDAINGVWADTVVLNGGGYSRPGYSRTMPTSLVLSEMPPFEGEDMTGFPWVGADLGDPASLTGCLPAVRRFNGGACP